MIKCNICGSDTIQIRVKEQMLGIGEWFTYFKCIYCGHAHLENIPVDIEKYYNSKEYYSFKKSKPLFKSGSFKAFRYLGLEKDAAILDYGCGAGQFVNELLLHGYKNTKGYDKYLPNELCAPHITRTESNIGLFYPIWDAITLNHVIEHLDNPIETLTYLHSKLKMYGKLILRFPVIDSCAFDKYRQNWVQFDAPRHINLFTRESIKAAISKVHGLEILAIYDDSTHFQFTGSDFYEKGQSLKNNSLIKRALSLKSYQYHFLAKRLNKSNRGDQIVVIIEKI